MISPIAIAIHAGPGAHPKKKMTQSLRYYLERRLAIPVAGIAGTLCMTTFSRLLSKLHKEDFTEHHLLDFVFRHWGLNDSRVRRAAAVSSHYAVGIAWSVLYAALLKKYRILYDPAGAIAVGALTGGAAVTVWKAMLSSTSEQPPTNGKKFLLQLVPAHMVFGLVSIRVLHRLLHKP